MTPSSDSHTDSRTWLVGILLMLVCFAVYGKTLGGGFLQNWDDNKYVVENAAAHGFSVANLKAAFSQIFIGNYAPVHILSYALDYTIWGLNPVGYHLSNILLHGFNGVLLYLLLWRIYGRIAVALPAALVFLLHPVQVESVAWVSQRKNLMAMLFFLLAVHCYVRWREGGGRWYVASLGCFVLALLAKSVAVILPVALLLMDVTLPSSPGGRRRLTDKVPYLLLAGGCAAVAMWSQGESFDGGRTPFHGGSPFATFVTMGPVFATYLRMLVWPSGLSAAYAPEIRRTLLDPAAFGSYVLLAAVVGVSLFFFFRRKDVACWIWFFFLALLPVSQVVPLTTLMNDRYLYFPMIGFAALVGIVFAGVVDRAGSRGTAASVVLGVLLATLATASFQRAAVWRDAFSLWSDAVAKSPRSRFAHQGLAEVLESRGALAAAAGEYRAAIALDPGSGELYNQLGVVSVTLGDLESARQNFQKAVLLQPSAAHASNLGMANVSAGKFSEAMDAFKLALRQDAASVEALAALAALSERLGDTEGARRYADMAARIYPAKSAGIIDTFRSIINGIPR